MALANSGITIVEPMTEPEARDCVKRINHHATEMGRLLLDLKERQGWRALGYDTWTECLQKEFSQSRQWLYVMMRAAPVQERLSTQGYKLSTREADVLARYPDHLQEPILRATQKRYDKVTVSRLERIASVLTQAVETGHVETEPGESTPIDQAYDLEDEEARKRQQAYHEEEPEGKLLTFEYFSGDLDRTIDRLRRIALSADDRALLKQAWAAI